MVGLELEGGGLSLTGGFRDVGVEVAEAVHDVTADFGTFFICDGWAGHGGGCGGVRGGGWGMKNKGDGKVGGGGGG